MHQVIDEFPFVLEILFYDFTFSVFFTILKISLVDGSIGIGEVAVAVVFSEFYLTFVLSSIRIIQLSFAVYIPNCSASRIFKPVATLKNPVSISFILLVELPGILTCHVGISKFLVGPAHGILYKCLERF
jgi:hypothetical protein